MKVQVLYFSKKELASTIADMIARDFQCKCDQIPPAYPCENEKIVFICVEGKGKPARQLVDFCSNLTIARAKNVAFAVVNDPEGTMIAPLAEILKNNGVNVISDVFHCSAKGGFFSKGKIDSNDIQAAMAWAKKIGDGLFNQ